MCSDHESHFMTSLLRQTVLAPEVDIAQSPRGSETLSSVQLDPLVHFKFPNSKNNPIVSSVPELTVPAKHPLLPSSNNSGSPPLTIFHQNDSSSNFDPSDPFRRTNEPFINY
jgi:hypothetical protein